MESLKHEAEEYSPNGNMSAKGASRLLGRPDLDWLEILLREAIQNIWDARNAGSVPECRIALRTLESAQLTVLRKHIFSDTKPHASGELLTESLRNNRFSVLEICDFKTAGLGGPSRADAEVRKQEGRNFIDFVRNFGSPRDISHGGGTYGFGKSALHEASRSKTIVVYSRAICNERMVSRLIAVRLGDPYEDNRGRFRRYTGRHFWGVVKEGVLEPLEGDAADDLAEALGMHRRRNTESGTSIMILDPQFDDPRSRENIARIIKILMWNFWPKMVTQPETGSPSMKFRLNFESENIPIGEPSETYPQLGMFCEAMVLLKAGKGVTIKCERPKATLGMLASISRQYGRSAETDDSHYPSNPHHVALMRPAELIVTYKAYARPTDPNTCYGGVFICDSDDEIEAAFADCEPPAHDDWEPSLLSKGRAKTFVKVALRRIREEVENRYAEIPSAGSFSNGENRSLAAVAESAAQLMGILPGDGASRNPPVHGGAGPSVRRPVIQFEKLEFVNGQRYSLFNVTFPVAGKFEFKASLHGFDGAAEVAPDGTRPQVSKISSNDTELDISKPVAAVENQKLIVYVTVPDDTAVKLSIQETAHV